MENSFNIWILRHPDLRAHLERVVADIGKNHMNGDPQRVQNLYIDILREHNILYTESIKVHALCDDKTLKEHQAIVKRLRRFSKMVEDGGKLHFRLHGWKAVTEDNNGRKRMRQGVTIQSIRVQMNGRSVEWDTSGLDYLPDKLGFDKLGNIVTDIDFTDDRYIPIKHIILDELQQGWTGDGNVTWMAPLHDFARQCGPFNEILARHLPDLSNKARAGIILDVFKFTQDGKYISPDKFAELLK